LKKLIAIYGSPKKSGTTDSFLNRFLSFVPGNVEIKKFFKGINFVGCDECDGCLG